MGTTKLFVVLLLNRYYALNILSALYRAMQYLETVIVHCCSPYYDGLEDHQL